MKPRLLKILEQCIDSGITLGYSRAHKNTDSPTEQTVADEISNAISNELHEWFSFDEHGAVPTRSLAGLSDSELRGLLERREIASAELTNDQLRLLDSKAHEWGLERVFRNLDLDSNIISTHQFWRIASPNALIQPPAKAVGWNDELADNYGDKNGKKDTIRSSDG